MSANPGKTRFNRREAKTQGKQIVTSVALRPAAYQKIQEVCADRNCSFSLILNEAVDLWLAETSRFGESDSAKKIAA